MSDMETLYNEYMMCKFKEVTLTLANKKYEVVKLKDMKRIKVYCVLCKIVSDPMEERQVCKILESFDDIPNVPISKEEYVWMALDKALEILNGGRSHARKDTNAPPPRKNMKRKRISSEAVFNLQESYPLNPNAFDNDSWEDEGRLMSPTPSSLLGGTPLSMLPSLAGGTLSPLFVNGSPLSLSPLYVGGPSPSMSPMMTPPLAAPYRLPPPLPAFQPCSTVTYLESWPSCSPSPLMLPPPIVPTLVYVEYAKMVEPVVVVDRLLANPPPFSVSYVMSPPPFDSP